MITEQQDKALQEINYQSEVKRVYPNAFLRRCNTVKDCWINNGDGIVLSDVDVQLFDANKAWQSAYENLKKQGKI